MSRRNLNLNLVAAQRALLREQSIGRAAVALDLSPAATSEAPGRLQINLLAEDEVTHLIKLTSAITTHVGIAEGADKELTELERDVAPEAVLDRLEFGRRDLGLGA